MTTIKRTTRETKVELTLGLYPGSAGEQAGDDAPSGIHTDNDFLTHMLETLRRYAGIDLTVKATGDLEHHLVEDVAITLGLAFVAAQPDTCRRYGEATVPMDDALVQAAVDIGGRHFYDGSLPDHHYEHFMRSLSDNARWTLHVRVLRGSDRHHVVEAAFKALGLALRSALVDEGVVFSTKGAVVVEGET